MASKNEKLSNQSGLTIMEILVVVVILIILTMVAIFNYSGVTSSARDARRREDLSYLSKILAVYYLDHGFFPTYSTAGISPLSCYLTVYPRPECTGLLTELRGYSEKIPFDPSDQFLQGEEQCANGSCYKYVTSDPAHSISCVCANLDKPPADSHSPVCQVEGYNYCIQVSY